MNWSLCKVFNWFYVEGDWLLLIDTILGLAIPCSSSLVLINKIPTIATYIDSRLKEYTFNKRTITEDAIAIFFALSYPSSVSASLSIVEACPHMYPAIRSHTTSNKISPAFSHNIYWIRVYIYSSNIFGTFFCLPNVIEQQCTSNIVIRSY